jgi:hypothetical protein
MKISDAYLKIEIGANLTPDTINLSGPTHVGSKYSAQAENTKAVFVTRLFFSNSAQTATLNPTNGVITLSAVGTPQIFTRVVDGGATAAGNLSCTLTSTLVAGSPLALNIPLSPDVHDTETKVATAIAEFINLLPAVTSWFKVTSKDARVIFTSIYGFANDATASLGITTGLGVSAGSTTGSVSGVQGVILQRQGGSGKDIFGDDWKVANGKISHLSAACVKGQVNLTNTGIKLQSGQRGAWSDPLSVSNLASEVFTAGITPAAVDVIAFCE